MYHVIVKKVFPTQRGLGNADINEVIGVPAKMEA